jgi:tetratricopeptide (TPR) repeat protein
VATAEDPHVMALPPQSAGEGTEYGRRPIDERRNVSGAALKKAEPLVNAGLAEERAAYLRILEGEPSNKKALLGIARIDRRCGDNVSAAAWLRRALSAFSDDLQASTELAAVLCGLNQPEEAAAIYCRVLAVNGDYVPAHMGLGRIARARGDEESARAHFAAAADLLGAAAGVQPDNPGPLSELAAALRELDRFDEAATILRRILTKNPEHWPSQLALGQMARRTGDNQGALDYFQAACERAPGELQPKLVLGRALTDMQRFDEAGEVFRLAVRQTPHDAQLREALGRLAARRRDWTKALEEYRAATSLDPANIAARLGLGQTYCELGWWEEAEHLYGGILENAPDHVDARLGLAQTAEARGDKAAALKALEDASKAAPLDLRPKKEIRRLRRAEDGFDWRTELEEALTVIRASNVPVQSQIYAAEVLFKFGITEPARPMLEKLAPHYPAAYQLLLAIRQLERMGLARTITEPEEGLVENQLGGFRAFVEIPVPASDTLLIVFAGANNRVSITLSLLHRILRKTGVSIIYCRDVEEVYYSRGVVGLGCDVLSTIESFRTLAGRYGARRILTLGHCLGVQPALRFGLRLGAQGVLGIGPRIETDGLKPHHQRRLDAIRQNPRYQEIRTRYLETESRPMVDFLYGEHYTVDPSGLESLAGVPGVNITRIPNSGDPAKDLLVRGLLEPVLTDFVATGRVSLETRALIASSANPQ